MLRTLDDFTAAIGSLKTLLPGMFPRGEIITLFIPWVKIFIYYVKYDGSATFIQVLLTAPALTYLIINDGIDHSPRNYGRAVMSGQDPISRWIKGE